MTRSVDEICEIVSRFHNSMKPVETIITYQVKQKQVILIMEKTPSGRSHRYKVIMSNEELGDKSETEILFTQYPRECIEHSVIIGNNNNRVYYANSGIQKNLKDIERALAKLYNVGVGNSRV